MSTKSETYRELWDTNHLPTTRQDLVRHPKMHMANLHSDDSRIAPVWTKVSYTPWKGRAELTGGYGRKMQVCEDGIDI